MCASETLENAEGMWSTCALEALRKPGMLQHVRTGNRRKRWIFSSTCALKTLRKPVGILEHVCTGNLKKTLDVGAHVHWKTQKT